MSVFYKFKSALTYDTIQFDDLHISLPEFKKAVIQQKQLGKNTNFDLQVTNAETNEVYNEQNSLIPKNSSLIVVRVPLSGTQKKWDIGDQLSSKIGVISSDYLQENAGNIVVKAADLAALNVSEDEKIQAMMFQSTVDYDPANYHKIKGGQYGDPPPNYVCHKCHNPGHWIRDCPITIVPDIKKSSGIPQSFMTPVDPSAPGAYMTPSGKFAVPIIDMQAYKEGKKEKPFIPSEETEDSLKTIIPDDLTCTLCHDLMSDVVMMPCCGTSFCDECIRNHLIESDDNQCPDCKEKDVSPDTLIPNRFLRNKVTNFRNQSGYVDIRRNEVELAKTRAIDHDQDVQIVETSETVSSVATAAITSTTSTTTAVVSTTTVTADAAAVDANVRVHPKYDEDEAGEKGSAIVVLDSASRVGLIQTRVAPANQRTLIGQNVKLSPDNGEGDRRKSSPGVAAVSATHVSSSSKKFSGPPKVPNTSQPPPGYGQQQPLQPIRPHHFAGNNGSGAPAPPVHYGPLPGVNPMGLPPHMPSQPPGRMFSYGPPPGYPPHMRGGFARSHHMHPNMHPHVNEGYPSRNNVVEDPEAAFESYLRERERQDRMKRNRGRRSRSRSLTRWKSPSRSRSRSSSKKRSSRSPLSPNMRKESPFARNSSRSPPGVMRRSESRGRTRLRSRSPRLDNRSPLLVLKKKRSRSITPPPTSYKKDARSPSPVIKKLRARSRTRSPNARIRKRRRSRSRTVSRSISRGRSFSRSLSPRRRPVFSPNSAQRRRRSPSPPRHAPLPSRNRGSHYRDHSPHHSTRYYEGGDRYKRNQRNARYPRGSRYTASHHNYETNNRYDRPNSNERYEEKRHVELKNGRDYNTHEEQAKSRSERSYSPPINNYERQYTAYEEVAPPGTTDLPTTFGYPPDLGYLEPTREERRGDYEQVGSSQGSFRDTNVARDELRKSKEYHERRRSRSRERHGHHHHTEHEKSKSRSSSQAHHTFARDAKKEPSLEEEKVLKDVDEKKEELRGEKRDKSKRKKKKESDIERKRKDSDVDRKKKKKVKQSKKDDSKAGKKTIDSAVRDESKTRDSQVREEEEDEDEDEEEEEEEEDEGDDVGRRQIPDGDDRDDNERNSKDETTILVSVPELSKWEREESSNSADEQRALVSKADRSDKKTVTNEILKHAEKVLFQKGGGPGTAKSARSVETKNELQSLKDELAVVETAREARKSGNSIKVTVPAVPNKSEDEGKPMARISAKHRLGAKVEERNYSAVRSLVEAKVKPRSTVKAVADTKQRVRSEASKHEKSEKHRDVSKKSRKEKRKEEDNHRHSEKHGKHRDLRETKEKNRNEVLLEPAKESLETESAAADDVEASSLDSKKQPIIDEANFEPDYDLTESEGEIRDDEAPEMRKAATNSAPDAAKEAKHASEKPNTMKLEEQTEDISSSASDSVSSSDSSNDRKKRKKRTKSKKKKKLKKRRIHSSSESISEESSSSESESDNKHKHKKKHKHKAKKSSKSTKKKKKSKYK